MEQTDAGRTVNEGNQRYKAINNRIMTMTGEFVDGRRSRGRFLKGCALNLAELPQPQTVAEDGGENNEMEGVVQELNWEIFDYVEGVEFVAPAVWQPWL